MTVRVLRRADTGAALTLYRHLVGDQGIGDSADCAAVITHPGTQIWGVFAQEALRAMATLHILPNVTQGARSYALIENVISDSEHRGAGHGRAVMSAVVDAAWAADCYKIMLLTGQGAGARGFYESLGFGAEEKWGMTLRRAPIRQT